MRQRLLGRRTGLRVSEMALGCGLLGATADGPESGAARETLVAFAENGGTLIDTSSAHQDGRSEELIGQFLADENREYFVVATKCGRAPGDDPRSLAGGAHPRAMIAQVEASLRRLATDRIDLYTVEFPDGVTPVEEVMRGLETLVRQGKVVAVALSNFPAWETARATTIAELRGWTPLSAVHHQYHLLDRSVEREILPMAKAFGLGVFAWSSQARGRLARPELDGVPAGLKNVLHSIAGARGVAPGTIALAWLLSTGAIPVVGARSAAQLAPSLFAAETSLTDEELALLDRESAVLDPSKSLLAPLRDAIGITDTMLARS